MTRLIAKLKPAEGFAKILHLTLLLLLPLTVFVFVRVHFVQLALAIILLSKWRMFAVRPRYWLANIRANSVDILVGVSILVLMVHSGSQIWELILTGMYAIWLIVIKPASGSLMVSAQAMVGQLLALLALFIISGSAFHLLFISWSTIPTYGLVLLSGLICYLAGRHFFDSFDEAYSKLLAYLWAYFGASLVWILGHWLLFYGAIAQPVLIMTVIGYGLAAIYYLDHTDRLSKLLRREFVFIMLFVMVAILYQLFRSGQHKIV